MALHFPREEYDRRIARARDALAARELDGLLMFAPESHYYLTGYETFGYAMFQCLVLSAGGELNLFTRLPDLRQAQQTSMLEDARIHTWDDVEGVDPCVEMMPLLARMGLDRGRLGVESRTVGLTAYNGERLRAALGERARLVEASDLVSLLRRDKSEREIAYHRRAAELSDDALDAAIATAGPGAFDGDVLAAMQGAVFQGGGGYAGNEFIVGSGEAALLCRYHSGPRYMDARDQLTLEWSGAFHRYHAAMMRTLVIGPANDTQRRMHAAVVEALEACEGAIVPGRPMGEVYDAHARVLDGHGFGEARMKACGYGMGAVFTPIWVDFPMFYQDNPLLMKVNNVFFLHMILMDSDSGYAMCWGHSVLVTESGVERLSRSPLELVENL